MAGKREVTILLRAKDEASKVLDNIAKGSIPNLAKTIGGLAATYVSFSAVKRFIEAATEASAEAQTATVKLAVAVQNTGQVVTASLPAYQAAAERIQDLTGVDDDFIKSHGALAVSLGRLRADGFERLSKAALDLGANIEGGPEAAFTALAKAAGGNVTALQKLGVHVDANASSADKLNSALTQIEARFGGSAAAQLQTYSGRLEELRNRWGNLLEKFGDLVTTSPAVLQALEGISNLVKSMTERLDTTEAQESMKALTITLLGFAEAGVHVLRTIHVIGASLPLLAKGAVMTWTGEQEAFQKSWANFTAFEEQLQETIRQIDTLQAKIGKASTTPIDLTKNLPKGGGAKLPDEITDQAKAQAKELAKLMRDARIANFVPGVSDFNLSPFEQQKAAVLRTIDQLQAVKKAYDESFVGGRSGASGFENQGPSQLPEDLETEAGKRLIAQLAAVKKAREDAFVGGFSGTQGFENQGPAADPIDVATFQRHLDQLNTLRDAELALTAPVGSIADSWGKVLSAVERVASAMPESDKAAIDQIQHLIDVARASEEKAASVRFGGADVRTAANIEAVNALNEAIAAISYLTPEQQKEFQTLTASLLGAGKQAESLGATMTEAFQGAAKNAAAELGGTLVDAAFGAKVAWGDAIRDIIKGLVKAVVQALIMKAITSAIGGASGGGVAGASEGAVIKASTGAIVPTYAAQGSMPAFKPRGTDTVPAMLTPGERVLTVKDTRAVQSGRIVIAARSSREGHAPGARSIGGSGGSLVAVPTMRAAPKMGQAAPVTITIKAPREKQAAAMAIGGIVSPTIYASAGTVAPTFAAMGAHIPSFNFAASGMLAPRVSPMLMPADLSGPDGKAQPILPGRSATSRSVNLTINAVDKRGVRELLIEHSDALSDALDYIDARSF